MWTSETLECSPTCGHWRAHAAPESLEHESVSSLEAPDGGLGLTRPPLHELAQSLFKRHPGLEADLALRLVHVCQPPPDRSRLPGRTIFRRALNAHHPAENGGQLGQAGLRPAGDIEDIVGD